MCRSNIDTSHLSSQFSISPRMLTHLASGAARDLHGAGGVSQAPSCSLLAMPVTAPFAWAQLQVHIVTTQTPQVS